MKKPKPQKGSATGLARFPYFDLGVLGSAHIAQPHGGGEYREMGVEDLFDRLQRDTEELLARAYHLSIDRWITEPDPVAQFEVPMEDAEELLERRALIQQGLKSANKSENAVAEVQHCYFVEQDLEEARNAATLLALVAQDAARQLEFLSRERFDLLESIARRFSSWPVNLGLGKPDKQGKRKLQNAKAAENSLRRLNVNAEFCLPETEFPESKKESPFRIAAQQIFGTLRSIRHDPFSYLGDSRPQGAKRQTRPYDFRPKLTKWGEDLLSLQDPMTERNADHWWAVAKVYLDEQWGKNYKTFAPLIQHLDLANPNFKPSLVRKQVIDDSLKKAFKALAAA
jgi:hypothetical protein